MYASIVHEPIALILKKFRVETNGAKVKPDILSNISTFLVQVVSNTQPLETLPSATGNDKR